MDGQVGRPADATAGRAGILDDAEHRLDSTISPSATTPATWFEPPPAQRPRTIALLAWRPMVKGALRGFATVELPIGLKLLDCPVYVGKSGAFATLPSKPQIDKEGRQKTDANGKPLYVAILDWRSRELRDRFSNAVVEAIRQRHPGALDGEAGR
jgi:hypothetical protein